MTGLTSPPSARPSATTDAPHRGRRIVGFVLVTLGVIIASVLAVWYFAEPDDTEAVFDYEQNSLCDWFTAEQMESIVVEALERLDLDAELESFATSGSCRMISGPRNEALWYTPGWDSQSDGGLGITLAPIVNDPRGEDPRDTDPTDFERHAVLNEGVTFGNHSSGFAFSEGVTAQLRVAGHEDEVLFLGFGVEGAAAVADFWPHTTELALSIADIMLEEMNWTG